MASKGIRFKVWANIGSQPKQFYFHRIHGNSKTVQPSEGYGKLKDVFDTIEADWYDTAVAQSHPAAINLTERRPEAIKRFISRMPVPYTRESLKPRDL